jgi:hypothetical protein
MQLALFLPLEMMIIEDKQFLIPLALLEIIHIELSDEALQFGVSEVHGEYSAFE